MHFKICFPNFSTYQNLRVLLINESAIIFLALETSIYFVEHWCFYLHIYILLEKKPQHTRSEFITDCSHELFYYTPFTIKAFFGHFFMSSLILHITCLYLWHLHTDYAPLLTSSTSIFPLPLSMKGASHGHICDTITDPSPHELSLQT